MRFVIPALILLIALAAVARTSPPGKTKPTQRKTLADAPVSALPADNPVASLVNIAELMARLPPTLEAFNLKVWLELEAALVSHPESVTALLLDRYAGEGDPIYKGLLAVLLATNPATHRRILDDFEGNGVDFWDLFRGMAILALVKFPSASVEEARSEGNLDYWKNLLRFLNSEKSDLKYERWEKAHPEEPGRIWSCGGGSWFRMRSTIDNRVGEVSSPEIRDFLLRSYEKDWEWDWIDSISRVAINRTTMKDPKFAEHIMQRYFATEERSRVILGFNLIASAPIPKDHLSTIENWARRAFGKDEEVFADSVELLGDQEGAESERILNDVYWLTEGNENSRARVLDAMLSNGGSSFKPVAMKELASLDPLRRITAVRLLDIQGDLQLVIDRVHGDTSPRVRYYALAALKECNPWTARAEEAAKRAAQSDPDDKVRQLASALLHAEDRGRLWTYSDYDWDDPGEE
jgi:hypothetical protein